MSTGPGFRSTILKLWYRLITLAIVALVFVEALHLSAGTAQGWTFYLTLPEVGFEVVVRFVAAALAGVALGTLLTVLIAFFLWYFDSARERLADLATKIAVVVVVFLVSRFALETFFSKWPARWSAHRLFLEGILLAAFYLAFAAALCIPRARREIVTSLDGVLTEKMTRRTAVATVIGTAVVVATEFALARTHGVVKAALDPQRPKSNFLLITFDALAAEDMSLYGRGLPTTPNIDGFARKGTVFTNFYSACDFTTPGVATILTGLYPSESHVYQLQGRLRAEDAERSLPHLMRAAGYSTGAFFSNPFAYYFARGFASDFDVLPEPVFQAGGVQYLWDATAPLHQDSGIGSQIGEYWDLGAVWNSLGKHPANPQLRFRAVESFEQARQILAKLADGFFLWVHVMTPHAPYLPDPENRGRFLRDADLRTREEESEGRWSPHYPPDQQSQVDQRRLRYDEFVATADRAFGSFMSDLETSGKLRNTTVVVSADHGESFEGGVYQHESPYLTRPVIHIPLIIRTPGQQERRTVAYTVDQTALAPTILELAGLSKPVSMRGQSLVGWLNRDGQGEGQGLAFTQYLERNSVFKPLGRGSVGVIDGQYEYVVYLDSHKGALRPLNEAQCWDLDRTAENPARAEALRAAIYARFPEVVPITT